MTMIACTLNEGFPIIHSDILVSSTVRPDTFYVPALTTNLMDLFSEEKAYYPAGLKRKVTLLNDRVCFAFAGDIGEAEKLLEDLKAYCRIMDDINKDQLYTFLKDYDLSDEVHFFIVVMEPAGDGYVTEIIYNHCTMTDIPVFGKMLVLGSGGPDFLQAASETVWPLSSIPTSPEEAVQGNMAMITGILSKERAFQDTFRNFWGAGIETIYWNGEQFMHLEQVSFVFHHWFRNTEHDPGHPFPVKVSHYKYIDDLLFIVDVVSPTWRGGLVEDKYIFDLVDLNFGVFVVGGIDDKRPVDWAKLREQLSFSSMFVGMGYIIIDGNRVLNPSGFHGSRDVLVEYRHNNSLHIEVQRSLYDRMEAAFDNSTFEK